MTARGTSSSSDLLERRARALARPLQRAQADERARVLRFEAGGDAFAIDIAETAAVGRPVSLTALPGAAAPLYAVASWRGRTISVLDVAAARDPGAAADLFIILLNGSRIAVLADGPPEIVARPERLAAPPAGAPPHAAAVLPDGTTLLDTSALRGHERQGKEKE